MAIDLGPNPQAPNTAPTDAERIQLRRAIASTNRSWTCGYGSEINLGSDSFVIGDHDVWLMFTATTVTSGVSAQGGTIIKTAHNLNNLDKIQFPYLAGGTGLNPLIVYYVRNKTDDTFQVSTTPNGSLATPNGYTDGNIQYTANAHNFGNSCTISGGENSSNSGDYCSISGNSNHSNSGNECLISGYNNYSNSGSYCSISGANNSTNSGDYCSISGRYNSSNSGYFCSISGENNLNNFGDCCLITGREASNNNHHNARIHGIEENRRFLELFPIGDAANGSSKKLQLLGSWSSLSNIYIPTNYTWIFKLSIGLTDLASNSAKYFEFKGVAINDGTGIILQSEAVGTPITIGSNISSTTAAITKNDTTKELIITVDNTSGTTTIKALAKLEILEIYNTI